jgi:hypothetical protein
VGPNHYVACHFPLEPGEQIDFARVGIGATIDVSPDGDGTTR